MMMRNLVFLLLLVVPPGQQGVGPSQSVVFDVTSAQIQAGDTVTLRWRVAGDAPVFISGLGKVEPIGERDVRLSDTTVFTLVTESAARGVVTEEVSVAVLNAKGDNFPPLEDFTTEYRYTVTARSVVDVLDRVHGLLQNTMHHSVVTHEDPPQTLVHATNLLLKDDLVSDDEPAIAFRRLAYVVRVQMTRDGMGRIAYTVSPLIEYRRRRERRWRRDTDQMLYEAEASRFARMLEAALAADSPPPASTMTR